MDPETILVDPSLPAASTMDSTVLLSQLDAASVSDSYAAASYASDSYAAASYASVSDSYAAESKSDVGAEESGTNEDQDQDLEDQDLEETDTGSTVSSVVAADSYRSSCAITLKIRLKWESLVKVKVSLFRPRQELRRYA